MALAEGPGGSVGGVTGATAGPASPAAAAAPPPLPALLGGGGAAAATPGTPGGAMLGATMPATPPRTGAGGTASTPGGGVAAGGEADGGGGGAGAGSAYASLLRSELLGASGGGGGGSALGTTPPGGVPPSNSRGPAPPSSPARPPGLPLAAAASPSRRVLAYAASADDALAGPPRGRTGALPSPAGALYARSPARPPRKVARTPFKVLDAPALADDFYLNLVDWSAGNVLAVGLGSTVYLWSAATAKVTKLVDLAEAGGGGGGAPPDPAGGDAVCSVSWSGRGTYLAVGTGSGSVQVWDAATGSRVRTLGGHRGRVGAMAWCGPSLATGSRDRSILSRDVRAPPGPAGEDDGGDAVTARLGAHRSEVCGLRWAPDGRSLASGGNDNLVHVWCPRRPDTPRLRLAHHTAAIKALAWSPHQHGLLASGGGTADRSIRVWNTAAGPPGSGGLGGGGVGAGHPPPPPPLPPLPLGGAPALGDPGPPPLGTLDTGSQVCNLAWARHANELVSTHGYSQNQVALWRYGGPGGPGSLSRLATLTGHTLRVLYLAAAPDGQTVVTGAGDETLRFWSVFPGPRSRGGGGGGGPDGEDGPVPLGAMARANIR